MELENNRSAQSTKYGMGTVMTHRVFGEQAEECLTAVWQEVERIEAILSCFLPGSEISWINRSAGFRCETVSPETYEVLSQAVEFSRHCQGCFDITMGPLVSLWSADPDAGRPPDISQIRQTLHLVNYSDLILDPYQRTAGLRKAGQSIDLGGIGKGFTGDKILDIYREFGISSAYSNLGGNVVTLGAKPDGSPWQIGIQHPRQENRIIGTVSVVNQSVVTSGDYQRYITDNDGNRYHHILDPLTGYPSESGLISVTVVADYSMTADALSTILFIAGMKKGLEILRDYPQTEVILVDTNMQIFVTKGLKDHFQADDNIQVNILEQ